MPEKRSILISARSRDEFDKIEGLLNLLNDSFIKNFQEVKYNVLGHYLVFKTENASQDSVIIPDNANRISVEISERKSKTSDTIVYETRISCHVPVGTEQLFILMETSGYYKISKINSIDIVKK